MGLNRLNHVYVLELKIVYYIVFDFRIQQRKFVLTMFLLPAKITGMHLVSNFR